MPNAVDTVTKAASNIDTNAIQTKIVAMFDALQNGAIEVGHQVVKYAPDVADTILWVIRINGIQNFLTDLAQIIIAIVLYKLASFFRKKVIEYDKADCDSIIPVFIVALILYLLLAFYCFTLLQDLTNIWNYIEVFQPKLYLAKEIINKALGAACNCN